MLESVCLIASTKVTPREYECLEWPTCGKSCTYVAQIVNVRPTHVARDVERVRAKLDVRSISQAIVLFAVYKAGRAPNTD